MHNKKMALFLKIWLISAANSRFHYPRSPPTATPPSLRPRRAGEGKLDRREQLREQCPLAHLDHDVDLHAG
jgi:hypothetical protein